MQGFTADGFFAEYAVEAWQNLAKLPSSTDLKTAAPIFCAGITAFHSVDSCELKEGQWLAVIGCGGLGQLACQYGKAMGYKVLGVDINDKTLEVFKKQGGQKGTFSAEDISKSLLYAISNNIGQIACVSAPVSVSCFHSIIAGTQLRRRCDRGNAMEMDAG